MVGIGIDAAARFRAGVFGNFAAQHGKTGLIGRVVALATHIDHTDAAADGSCARRTVFGDCAARQGEIRIAFYMDSA